MASMTTKIEHLKNEIKTRQEELAQLEDELSSARRKNAIRPLEEVTVEEKVAFFNESYRAALNDLEYAKENGSFNEDSAHYSWEYAMETLAWPDRTRDFWDHFSSFIQ